MYKEADETEIHLMFMN